MRKIRVRRWTDTWRCTNAGHMGIATLAVIGCTHGTGFCGDCLYSLLDFLKQDSKRISSIFIPSHVPRNAIAPIERFVAAITRSR